MKKYKNIFLINADPIKNAGNIKDYFKENSENFSSFHFFPGYSDKPPYFEKYLSGKKIQQRKFDAYKGNNFILKTLNNHLSFYYCAFFMSERRGYLITNAPLFMVGNSVLKIFKSITPVLWFGDYYTTNKFPMNIYNTIVNHYNRSLKYVIYLNPRLKEVYQGNFYKNRKVISLGIKTHYKKKNKPLGKRIKVGFIGVIRKQQGLDLFFKYLVENKDCTLDVVGEGYSLNEYKRIAKKLKILNKVKFHGSVEDLSKIFPKWDLGIALYENTSDNLSKYAEPTKIKDYLSFGLPVITTKTTYFYEEIEKYKAGYVVDENINSIKKALENIKKNYPAYLKGVNAINEKYEYEKWYDEKFKFLKS